MYYTCLHMSNFYNYIENTSNGCIANLPLGAPLPIANLVRDVVHGLWFVFALLYSG